VFISLLFLCVTLHELGHSLVALQYGATVRDITLLPIGGVARLENEMTEPNQELWMALAGPVVNIVLAGVLGAVAVPLLGWRALGGLELLRSNLSSIGVERLVVDLFLANVGLALFNLLPAFPMDGGRVLRALLATRLGEIDATRIAARVGQGLAVVLGLAGLFTGGINLTFIAVFIFAGAEQERRAAETKATLKGIPASAALLHGSSTMLSPSDPLGRAIDVMLRTGQAEFAVLEGDRMVGILSQQNVAEDFQKYGPYVPVGRVMRTDFPVVQAGEPLLNLQAKMQSSGTSVVSVIEGRRFLGLVTLEDLRNAFQGLAARRWRYERA
jgi:stage IV sporulation protein FB